jgi:hypothetical protein
MILLHNSEYFIYIYNRVIYEQRTGGNPQNPGYLSAAQQYDTIDSGTLSAVALPATLKDN